MSRGVVLVPAAEPAELGDVVRGRIATGAGGGGGWEDVGAWLSEGDGSPPDVPVADDGPLRHENFGRTDLSSLRKASAMPVEVLRELSRRLPDVALWNFYGQTEMAPPATILRPHEQLPHAGPAGEVIAHARERLAGYECPKCVVFADELPENPSGKTVERELRRPGMPGRRKGVNIGRTDFPVVATRNHESHRPVAPGGPGTARLVNTRAVGPGSPGVVRPWYREFVRSRQRAPFHRPEEVSPLSAFIAVLIALGAGLFVGSRVHRARTARVNFSAYKTRTARGFGEWIRSTVSAVLAVGGALALMVVVFNAIEHT